MVVMDLASDVVLEKSKAPTTRWDPSIGVGEALDSISPACRRSADLVALSTTLATNAIVEGRGQPVGLLIMPPYGRLDPDNFTHAPKVAIQGQMDIDGTELVPVDIDEVRRVARELVTQDRVTAFAAAGFAGHVNPAHELAVKDAVRAETGLPVTCGYEITDGANYRIRAETAALNARIMPYLDRLIGQVQHGLVERGILAPVMVVRSDGSLVSLKVAKEQPILTLLSGPAASVAGARHLAGCSDAVVIDIGGTTTDMAIVTRGEVPVCAEGAIVGQWQTHVAALDMRTVGLGGDSRIQLERGNVQIGPQRVAPIGWLVHKHPAAAEAIRWVESNARYFDTATGGAEIIVRLDVVPPVDLTDQELSILATLAERPLSMHELAARVNSGAWQFISVESLENRCLVQRCGLTPTDVLQTLGRLDLYGKEGSRRITAVYARLLRMDVAAFGAMVLDRIVEKLALETMQVHLDRSRQGVIEASPAAVSLLKNAMSGGTSDYRVAITLARPLVGVGAPAGLFVPGAAKRLGTEACVPEHADVANAVGAAISSVRVVKRATIGIDERGRYRVEGLPGTPRFEDIESAQLFAEEELRKIVTAMAAETGTDASWVEIRSLDHTAGIAMADTLFIERFVEARLCGKPAPTGE